MRAPADLPVRHVHLFLVQPKPDISPAEAQLAKSNRATLDPAQQERSKLFIRFHQLFAHMHQDGNGIGD